VVLIEERGIKQKHWQCYWLEGGAWVNSSDGRPLSAKSKIQAVVYSSEKVQQNMYVCRGTREHDAEDSVEGRDSVLSSVLFGTLTGLDAKLKKNQNWTEGLLEFLTRRYGSSVDLRHYIEPYLFVGHFKNPRDGVFPSCMKNNQIERPGRHVPFRRYVKEVCWIKTKHPIFRFSAIRCPREQLITQCTASTLHASFSACVRKVGKLCSSKGD
jgi:hypothetical protein